MQQIVASRPLLNAYKKFNVDYRAGIKATLGRHVCTAKRHIIDTSQSVKATTPAALCAASNEPPKEPNPLGAHGPKLLPRPVRLKPSGGGNGGGPNNGGERTLASLIAYSGLVGTTALVLAYLSGIDIWSGFEWSSTDDLRLALLASLPLQLLNAALLLPSFTTQRLPDMGNLQAMETRLQEEQKRRRGASSGNTQQPQPQPQPPQPQPFQRPVTDGGSGPASSTSTFTISGSSSSSGPTSSSQSSSSAATAPAAACSAAETGLLAEGRNAATMATPAAPAGGVAGEAASAGPGAGFAGEATGLVKKEAGFARASSAGEAGAGASDPKEAGARETGETPLAGSSERRLMPPGSLPAAVWGSGSNRGRGATGSSGRGKALWGLDGAGVRSSLHLAQGYYISSNPTARLSPALEAAVAAVETAAGEMLYRGVALTWLARWLEDRMYELGLDELIRYQLPSTVAEWGGSRAADAVAALGVHGMAECAAASGVVLYVVWSVLNSSRRATRRLESMISVAASAGSRQGHGSGSSSGDVKVKAAERKGASRGDSTTRRVSDQVLLDPQPRFSGPLSGVEVASAVMRRAAAIQATRDAAQVLLLNGVFIVTGGNLAASYTAALLNQLVISAMQRRGMRRIRERSAALARELQAYNAEMHRIVLKYKDKLPPEAASRLEAMKSDETSGDTGSTTANPVSLGGPDGGTTSTSSLSNTSRQNTTIDSSSSSNKESANNTTAHDTSQTTPFTSSSLAVTTTLAANGNSSVDSSSRSGKLQWALSALDQLVPDPPKPHKMPSPFATRQQQQQQQGESNGKGRC